MFAIHILFLNRGAQPSVSGLTLKRPEELRPPSEVFRELLRIYRKKHQIVWRFQSTVMRKIYMYLYNYFVYLTLSPPECRIVEFCKVYPNFWVCGRNPIMWPFKWNLSTSTYTWCYLFFKILQTNFGIFYQILPLATFGSERLKQHEHA